jgi:acyl carrier protein
VTTTAPVNPELVRLIAELCDLDPVQVRPEASLVALGLDSVLMAELALAIEDVLGVHIAEEDVAGVETLADLDVVIQHLRTSATS